MTLGWCCCCYRSQRRNWSSGGDSIGLRFSDGCNYSENTGSAKTATADLAKFLSAVLSAEGSSLLRFPLFLDVSWSRQMCSK